MCGFRDLNDFQVAAVGAEIGSLRDVGDSRKLSSCKISEDVSHNREEMKIKTREERAGALATPLKIGLRAFVRVDADDLSF